MNTLTFGSLVVNIEIILGLHLDDRTRPPVDITFKTSEGEVIYSVGASNDDDITKAVGEYVLLQRNIALGGKYPELFRAVGTQAMLTWRGDILLEPIFFECGMIKRDNEYVLSMD